MSAIATTVPQRKTYIGFGCLDHPDVARFVVDVPRGKLPHDKVRIREHVGNGIWSERIVLSRDTWDVIAGPVAEAFNRRLAAAKPRIKAGSWKFGETVVERQLGLELLCLAYAVEEETPREIRTATLNWLNLTPEERRWLAMRGMASEGRKGWREAIGVALTDRRPQT